MMILVALSLFAGVASGFVAPSTNRRIHHHPRQSFLPTAVYESTTMTSDFGSAMPETVSPYERIGITEDQLALGINPEDVLAYLGTRDDIIDRAMKDIPSLDRTQAEAEVDKFLLDNECLRIHIEFNKKKAEDPDFSLAQPEAQDEGIFSFRTIVILYLGYVAYTTVPTIFRRWVEGKQAAGEWDGSGIPFIDEWLQNAPPLDVAQLSDTASTVLTSITDLSSSGLR